MRKLILLFIFSSLFLLTGCPNPHPFPEDDFAITLKNSEVTINVKKNDYYRIFDVTLTIETQPKNGKVVINSDKTITYTPDKDYVGIDSFTYELDNKQEKGYATVKIAVKDEIIAPVAVDDNYEVKLNEKIIIEVIENDIYDNKEFLLIFYYNVPINCVVKLSHDKKIITFWTRDETVEEISFNYTISDGLNSDSATVFIKIIK